MVGSTLSLLAAIGMAIGAPLIYADQANTMAKLRDSTGFSKDVCAVILLSNIARLIWWFHERYEIVLLIQSILMVVAQIALLGLVLRFQPGSYASAAYTSSHVDYQRGDPGPASSRQQQQPARPQINVDPPTPEQGTTSLPGTSNAAEATSGGAGGANEYSNPGFASLFGGSGSSGRYAPIVGDFRFPTMPVLDAPEGYADDHEDEQEDTDPVSLPARLLRQAKQRTSRLTRQLKPLLGVRNDGSLRADGSSSGRPFGFWTWRTLDSYLLFLGCYTFFLALLQVTLGRHSSTYNSILGLYALGLESTLPLPQLIANQKRRSLAGFRLSVLLGWGLGDAFKTVYFLFIQPGSPFQFLAGALFSLSVDLGIVAQYRLFAEQTERDEEELRVASEGRRLEEAERVRRGRGEGTGSGAGPRSPAAARSGSSNGNGNGAKAPTKASTSASQNDDPWFQEHADLDEDAVLFDSSHGPPGGAGARPGGGGGGGAGGAGGGPHMFTIEADED